MMLLFNGMYHGMILMPQPLASNSLALLCAQDTLLLASCVIQGVLNAVLLWQVGGTRELLCQHGFSAPGVVKHMKGAQHQGLLEIKKC
jgi:hypothetical protein